MAEIKRRSEIILEARRKRRRRILLTCVPLTLCAVLASALALPGILTEQNREPMAGGAMESAGEGLTCGVIKIEISGPDTSRTYTAAEDIRRIVDGINACREDQSEYSGMDVPMGAVSQDDGQANGTGSQVQAESVPEKHTFTFTTGEEIAPEGYTVTFITDEGSGPEYCFAGNMLTDLSTGQIYPLTQKQAEKLRDLLGISDGDIS